MHWQPLSADLLEQIGNKLQQDPNLANSLLKTLAELLAEPDYQEWFNTARLEEKPYQLLPHLKEKFESLELCQNGYLRIQAHKLLDTIFLTDPPCVDRRTRVYPYEDESLQIHNFMVEKELYRWPDIVVDIACGCGHHTMSHGKNNGRHNAAWSSQTQLFALDINNRACAFAEINKIIHGADVTVLQNDVGDGLPSIIYKSEGCQALFLVNMPFGMAPLPGVLSLASDGGRTGAALTFKAFESIKNFWQSKHGKCHVRAVVLVHTIGRSPTGEWEVVNKAIKIFGENAINFILLNDLMVRINGLKRFVSPITIEQYAQKADCRFDVSDKDRAEARRGYANLITSLSKEGWSHIGYGIVEIDLPPKHLSKGT